MTLLALLRQTFTKTLPNQHYSQIAHLIRDFYREDPADLQKLKPLASCRLVRRWGKLRIHCPDLATASAVIDARGILEVPIAQLRLAKTIGVLTDEGPVEIFKVSSHP
ncbi:hypothetical protein KR51_00021690 [Rubidibacter lacunae KORDI 51-2]|uniref:Uncharacterized protein n=1 Tax=Rubidibacter lacunae KORDI 51-2 TaxID=582515 RepID=U5DL33_9CHRO|nr:hypothetical protein [Rubidibacter lacunae]ERN41279.1 hypothetical protein KR51_00021690 [Rubidibacter lacunae KORDI 51-2]